MSWEGGIVSLFYPESVLTVNSGNLLSVHLSTASWHREMPIPGTKLQHSCGRLKGGYKMITILPQGDKSPSAKIVLCM